MTHYGYRLMQMGFRHDTVNILIKSKTGEEQISKPILLFCQGSLPQPLIKVDDKGAYDIFPFAVEKLLEEYHLVIIGKPGIPLVCNVKELGRDFTYMDANGNTPEKYTLNNTLDYYVKRNIRVLKFLGRQPWAGKGRVVVAGHSEGSTIAAKMASAYGKITHLIYSGGNPMGRIMSMMAQSRKTESNAVGEQSGEDDMVLWQSVVDGKNNTDGAGGDSYKTTYEFSIPPIRYLEKLDIPVLVSYGTKDWSTPFNDYLRVEMVREGKHNFEFKAYIGAEHNYFPVDAQGKVDYDTYNWDKVAEDWRLWLKG
ncbi:alpha/beta hydrolase [Flavobacterium pallidum]|uniref:Alpha/beta hydrolase n=1 Tax=Flavobacterium pallidum TaxID=2172098 RepID=A0A2S1SL08_9FLAO|nr:alpha/beta hydrolase [Flavobacterium pallidum]